MRPARDNSRWARTIAFLKLRPATSRAIARAIDVDHTHNTLPNEMVNYHKLIVIGTVEQAYAAGIDFDPGLAMGQKFLRRNASVYAIPRTRMLPKVKSGKGGLRTKFSERQEKTRIENPPAHGEFRFPAKKTIPQYRWRFA